jgi:hypothetical protein
MGKRDKNEAYGASNEAVTLGRKSTGQGAQEATQRVGELIPRSDNERSTLNKTYGDFGGSTADRYSGELNSPVTRVDSGGGGGGGGNSGGGGGKSSEDYVGVWEELMGKTGGFDPTRLGNINSVSDKLRGAGENYGGSKEAAEGLMGIGRTGGISDTDRSAVNRDYLLEAEKTGGYGQGDIANIRSRANSATPAFYQNLKEGMDRSRGVSNFGPGMDRSSFKLARQGAQDQGNAARDTEIGIADSVRGGRMDASKFLSGQNLSLADMTAKNKLSGYGAAGEMDINRNKAIEDAMARSAGIDLDTQGQITGARLGASTAKGQDARARQSIGAASGAAAGARADANKRWASQMAQEDRMFGARGLSDTYTAAPTELMFNQNLLRDYRKDFNEVNQQNVQNRLGSGQVQGSWQGDNWTKLGVGAMGMMSSRELKENIIELDPKQVKEALKTLPIYLWNYKEGGPRHIGPMAEEFHEAFGVGDGKTLNLVDVMGVLLAAQKSAILEKEG